MSNSALQPTTTKPLLRFDEYAGVKGRALSVRIDLRDMAAYYREDARFAGAHARNWSSAPANKFIQQSIRNAEDAIAAVKGFDFPVDLRAEARRHARSLTHVFAQTVNKVIQRDQVTGRMDRRKLDDVALHTALGTFDAQQVRPFRRITQAPIKPPVIALVASAGNAEMWMDAVYIPRVLALVLSITWAAEAAGLPTYAALVQGHSRLLPGGQYREAHQVVMVAEPGKRISPTTYAVGMHRDLWRNGLMTAWAADYTAFARLLALRGEVARTANYYLGFPCLHGGNAVRWARQMLDADVVISIGANQDARTADIQLGSRFSVSEAVQQVVQQAKALAKRRNG
jgi:hypothetical protein